MGAMCDCGTAGLLSSGRPCSICIPPAAFIAAAPSSVAYVRKPKPRGRLLSWSYITTASSTCTRARASGAHAPRTVTAQPTGCALELMRPSRAPTLPHPRSWPAEPAPTCLNGVLSHAPRHTAQSAAGSRPRARWAPGSRRRICARCPRCWVGAWVGPRVAQLAWPRPALEAEQAVRQSLGAAHAPEVSNKGGDNTHGTSWAARAGH